MKVGRVAEHWHKNVVAVGLSQGFIEPLEATALLLVQLTIQGFIASLDQGNVTDEKTKRIQCGHQRAFRRCA